VKRIFLGAKAIELTRESRFDVLVTDLRIPGVDGTSLVARAKRLARHRAIAFPNRGMAW
jgi:YesN/AraC family two-component response regulator